MKYFKINTSVSVDVPFNEKINIHEILKIIKNLKGNTVASFDGVLFKTLKHIAVNIIKPLTHT